MNKNKDCIIELASVQSGKATIVAKFDDKVVFMDKFDPAIANARAAFRDAVVAKGFDGSSVEQELLSIGDEIERRSKSSKKRNHQATNSCLFDGEHSNLPTPFQPFPVDCLPNLAANFVRQGARAIDADDSMVALPLMSCIASCIGSARRVQVSTTWKEPAVLWTCTVAKSGSAKSPAASLAIDLLKEISDVFDVEHSNAIREWKDKGGVEGEPPIEKRIITTNGTLPALASLLQANPKGILYYADELAGWLKDQSRYAANKADDSDSWNELYDGRSFWNDRKTAKSLKVRFPNVCVTGSIQPTRLFRIFGQDHLDSGLAARIVFAQPPHRIRRLTGAALCDAIRGHVKDRLMALWNLRLDYNNPIWHPKAISLCEAAYKEFRRFHDDHQERVAEADGALNAALSKLTAVALRLALIFELFGDPCSEVVSADAIKRSIVVTRWFTHEAERLYSGDLASPENKLANTILETLAYAPRSTVRDLSQKKRSLRSPKATAEMIEAQLMRMKRGGIVDSEDVGTNGRPKRIWFVANPQNDLVAVTKDQER